VKRILIFLCLWLATVDAGAEGVVVIAHPSVPKTDLATLQRVYSGKIIEIGSVNVTPINALPGSPERIRFLREFLQQDEEKYTAYWTVRRYIGKGTPPLEVGSAAEMIAIVQATPGAIGYINDSELKAGATVLLRR